MPAGLRQFGVTEETRNESPRIRVGLARYPLQTGQREVLDLEAAHGNAA